jgi:hypothetical protein
MPELEPLLPGRHPCTPERRCRSVPAVYPVTAAVIARASARSRSTAHVRRWRPALAGHPAERRPPDRRKPLPRGGEGKGLLRDVRLPARAAYIAIMSQLTRTCQSRVDARHRTRGRVAVGPGQGGLCQAALADGDGKAAGRSGESAPDPPIRRRLGRLGFHAHAAPSLMFCCGASFCERSRSLT